jgi:acetylornithine deacetylase
VTEMDLMAAGWESVQICRRLVRINTVNPYSGDRRPGGERAGQDYLEHLWQKGGARTVRFEPPEDIYSRFHALGPKNRSWRDRPVLVGEWSFGDKSGPRILLFGHIDTVGTIGMTTPPFSGTLRDGKIFGRGSSDCKSGLAAGTAAVLAVAKAAADNKADLCGSLVLVSAVDEECDGIGAGVMAVLDRGYRGDFAVSLDGPGLKITEEANGVVTASIVIESSGGHAAAATSGLSALERALKVAQTVQEFKAYRTAYNGCAVNLGVFHSGTHPAQVPNRAVLGVNISYTYEEAGESERAGCGFGAGLLRPLFIERIKQVDNEAQVEWVKDGIPFKSTLDHDRVMRLAAAHTSIVGEPPEHDRLLGWTDACWMATAGIPTVIYGAATAGQAHTPNEYMDIKQLNNCAKVLVVFLYNMLCKV